MHECISKEAIREVCTAADRIRFRLNMMWGLIALATLTTTAAYAQSREATNVAKDADTKFQVIEERLSHIQRSIDELKRRGD